MNHKILTTLEFNKILNKLQSFAATSLGKAWVSELKPSGDLEEVKNRLQATDEAVKVERLKGAAPFGGIRDVRSAVKRAQIGGLLNPAELLDTANTLNGGRRLKRFLVQMAEDHEVALLAGKAMQIMDLKELAESILAKINEHAEVMDSASQELARIRHELRTGESRIREKLEQMIRTPSTQKMLQDPIITIRNDRYVIPVKQEYRSSIGGMIHDQSASGATLFMEPQAVVQLNNRLRELSFKEEREIEKILTALTAEVAESAEEIAFNLDILAELDFIFAKAGLAREYKGTLPLMNDRGFLKIKKGRHPLIAKDSVVPLDVELGNHHQSIIITGPNTGGKTVTLKTIGLLSLMAMSGLFVPAEDSSQLCVFDAIYADIGDEQSIEQSLSTFSSHMTNIINILNEMTAKSLVLLDEVGAGTDPAEGSALAISILESIHQLGCRMVATTHYSELKAYAYERKGIVNASMEFDVQTLSPTYRLLVGVPGRSNAFAIAERLGLSKSIIDHARSQVGADDQRVESMIATLEENRLTAEAERKSAEQLNAEVAALRQQLEKERSRMEQQRSQLLAKAREEAEDAVKKARLEADEIIRELRQMAMQERSSIKEHKLIEAKRKLDEAVPKLDQKPQSSSRSNGHARAIEPGDEVLVRSLGQKGHVVELSGEKEATVQLGILKMKIAKSDLEKLSSAAPQQVQKTVARVKRSRDEQVRTELDLRGKNIEESIIEVDRFLDESFLANLPQVYIIHGKGTGVLRQGIQDYLRKHRLVTSFREGAYGEGGNGVTVVEL